MKIDRWKMDNNNNRDTINPDKIKRFSNYTIIIIIIIIIINVYYAQTQVSCFSYPREFLTSHLI